MQRADAWFMCRVGVVECGRALRIAGGPSAAAALESELDSFGLVEVDAGLCERALELAAEHGLRSLDALHLAAALALPPEYLTLATWDRRLHDAARSERLLTLPERLP